MRLSTFTRLLCLCASVALLVASCAEDKSRDNPTKARLADVRVALFGAGNTLPVHAAATRGIFERNGLDVTITEGTDLPVFMAALVNGQYDIAMSTPTLALVGAQKGLDLQIISSTSQQTREQPNAVWITKDPSIRSLSELKGKAVAVPSLTGIITDAMVYLLEQNGLSRNDVRFVQTPFPAMADQLAAGHVDAAVATLPFSTALAARGFHVHDDVIVEAVHGASRGSVDEAITTVWTAPRTYASAHPEVMSAWQDSLQEAIELLDADEAAAREMMADWLKMPVDLLQRAPLPDWTVDITSAQLRPYVDIAKAAGSIDSDPDVDSLVWRRP